MWILIQNSKYGQIPWRAVFWFHPRDPQTLSFHCFRPSRPSGDLSRGRLRSCRMPLKSGWRRWSRNAITMWPGMVEPLSRPANMPVKSSVFVPNWLRPAGGLPDKRDQDEPDVKHNPTETRKAVQLRELQRRQRQATVCLMLCFAAMLGLKIFEGHYPVIIIGFFCGRRGSGDHRWGRGLVCNCGAVWKTASRPAIQAYGYSAQ